MEENVRNPKDTMREYDILDSNGFAEHIGKVFVCVGVSAHLYKGYSWVFDSKLACICMLMHMLV